MKPDAVSGASGERGVLASPSARLRARLLALGATVPIAEKLDFIGGVRFFHMSNANMHGRDENPAINGVQGEGARPAYGQLVCTADALVEVRGVLFAIDGEPVNAPTAGENSSEPLTCDHYANMVAISAE